MKARLLLFLLLVLAAGAFAYLNAGERTTLNLGIAVLHRLPLTGVVFGAFLLGMVTMFLFALRHDLRVRRALRDQYVNRLSSESDVWTEHSPP